MTKNEVLKLQPQDRVIDNRDNVKATVLNVNADVLRILYDDSQSSSYIWPDACQHLTKVDYQTSEVAK